MSREEVGRGLGGMRVGRCRRLQSRVLAVDSGLLFQILIRDEAMFVVGEADVVAVDVMLDHQKVVQEW